MKPVQTGFPADSDAQLVADAARGQHTLGAHAAELQPGAPLLARPGGAHATTLFAWSLSASPHLAVEREGRPVSDAQLVRATTQALSAGDALWRQSGAAAAGSLTLVETAGGVCSPSPSGALQVWGLNCGGSRSGSWNRRGGRRCARAGWPHQ